MLYFSSDNQLFAKCQKIDKLFALKKITLSKQPVKAQLH